jgi:hypothetical protein
VTLQIMPFTVNWRDAKGWVGHTRIHIALDDTVGTEGDVNTQAANYIAAVGGLTNCAYQGSSLRIATPPGLTYGDNAEYPAEWMKAVMQWSTDLGTITRFKIPAPEIDLFDSDGITILNDGTQAQVVAYVAAIKLVVNGCYFSTASGLAYTHFEGGQLKLGKQPRRFNERIKSSHLVAGEGV